MEIDHSSGFTRKVCSEIDSRSGQQLIFFQRVKARFQEKNISFLVINLFFGDPDAN